MVTVTAVYSGGVLRPADPLDLPDGARVTVQIADQCDPDPPDPKDALMDDGETLRAVFAEFADEDRELADAGLTHYARVLNREEDRT